MVCIMMEIWEIFRSWSGGDPAFRICGCPGRTWRRFRLLVIPVYRTFHGCRHFPLSRAFPGEGAERRGKRSQVGSCSKSSRKYHAKPCTIRIFDREGDISILVSNSAWVLPRAARPVRSGFLFSPVLQQVLVLPESAITLSSVTNVYW